ncbi:MAG TPA: dynamin family protein [Synechococcales cyanobacterium M55_K2018_004]|nr:dynamin family protein [Synechococcales cyanobacterium M55_K2018_004]
MAYKAESFIHDLDKVAKARQEFSGYLSAIAETLAQAEQEGENTSGKLGFESTIDDLQLVSRNLGEGVFRLLVLGDMKRGKSTFLNALIGESILPTDVNPCTAVLTVLSYGPEKQVTVYFKDEREPEQLDFETFKQRYTIPPEVAKKLQDEGISAFPNVAYAEVQSSMVYAVTGVFLGPIGMALAGLGLGSLSTEMTRRKVVLAMREELVKLLPQIAQEQSFQVYQAVKECFDTYQQEVVKRMNEDIHARKTELDELVRQKEDNEINQQAEERRLDLLDNTVLSQLHDVEDPYDQLIGQPVLIVAA